MRSTPDLAFNAGYGLRAGVTNIGDVGVSITLASRPVVIRLTIHSTIPMEEVMESTQVAAVAVNKPNGVAKVIQPSYAELKAKIEALEAAAKLANAPGKLTIRINDAVNAEGVQGKGTVCVYGLGRFPVALYAEQWERLLTQDHVGTILQICKDPRASRKVR